MIKAILFDWGNTLMIDYCLPGPMYTWDKVAWVPGAESSLKEISEHYPCYVATNADQSDSVAVLQGLDRIGAGKYFRNIFTSKDLGYEKPEPGFFQGILNQLGIQAKECVMIGDNYLKDIAGAKRCGIKTVFFNAKNQAGAFPEADLVINHMQELPASIEKL